MTKPILSHPDFSPKANPFILYVDTSHQGVGAVLSQEQEIEHNGKKVPAETVIAYASKSLTTGESHYGAYKLELSGLVFAMTHFRYYLLGKMFIVRTDHKGLEWIRGRPAKALPALIYRWQDVLAEYNFKIEYIPGKKLSHVDGLSRRNYLMLDTGTIKTYPSIPGDTDDDVWIQRMKERVQINSVNSIGDRPKRNVPQVQYSDKRTYKPRAKKQQETPAEEPESQKDNLEEPPGMADPNDELELEVQEYDLITDDEERELMKDVPTATTTTQVVKTPIENTGKIPTLFELQKQDPYWGDLIKLLQQKGVSQLDCANPKDFLQDLDWNPNNRTRRCQNVDNKQTVRLIARLRNFFILGSGTEETLCLEVPKKEHEGPGCRKLYVLPHSEVQKILQEQHDTLVHPGVNGMMNSIGNKYWWPAWKRDVHEFVSSCNICDSIKFDQPRNNVSLGQTTSKGYPRLVRWSVDFVQFPPSGPQRFNYLVTLQDFTTRYLEVFPVKSPDSVSITKIMTERMIPEYGPYLTLVSDNGRAFVSKVIEEYCKNNNIVRHLVIPYSPKSNPVERLHRTLKTKIKCALAETMGREDQWLTVLPKVKAAFNHSPLSDSGLTPAFLKMGRDIAISFSPDDFTELSHTPEQVKKMIDDATEVQVNAMRQRHEQNQLHTDKKVKPLLLKAGDLVDLWRPFDVHHMGASRKFQRHWSGPYTVLHHDHFKPHRVLIETHPDVNLPYKKLVVHLNHVKLRKPYLGKPSNQQGPGFHLRNRVNWDTPIEQQQPPPTEEDERSSDDDDDNDAWEGEGEDTSYFLDPGESPLETTREVEMEHDSAPDAPTVQMHPAGPPEPVILPPEVFMRRSPLTSPTISTPRTPRSHRSLSQTSSASNYMESETQKEEQLYRPRPSGASSSSSSVKSRLGPRVDSPETPPPQRMLLKTPPSGERHSVFYRIGPQGPEATISPSAPMDEDTIPTAATGARPKNFQKRLGRFAYQEDPSITPPQQPVMKRNLPTPSPDTMKAEEQIKKPSKLSKLAQAFTSPANTRTIKRQSSSPSTPSKIPRAKPKM
jgi:transposase InsO family protein